MTTDKTIIFASLFNQVSGYFYEIAPKRKGKEEVEYQDEAGLWQRELKDYFYIDKYAEVINITKCPISQEVFLEAYADFKSEFHKYAFLCSGDLIRNILGGSFDIKDTPTQKQLLKANLIEETALLNCYIEAQKFINDILYAGVPWLEDEPDGITIYRKNNSKENNQNENDPNEGIFKDETLTKAYSAFIEEAFSGKYSDFKTMMNFPQKETNILVKNKDAMYCIIRCFRDTLSENDRDSWESAILKNLAFNVSTYNKKNTFKLNDDNFKSKIEDIFD